MQRCKCCSYSVKPSSASHVNSPQIVWASIQVVSWRCFPPCVCPSRRPVPAHAAYRDGMRLRTEHSISRRGASRIPCPCCCPGCCCPCCCCPCPFRRRHGIGENWWSRGARLRQGVGRWGHACSRSTAVTTAPPHQAHCRSQALWALGRRRWDLAGATGAPGAKC
jgi:hypothetical protein